MPKLAADPTDHILHARGIRARHVRSADGLTCAACRWPYPCPESSRAAFVLADSEPALGRAAARQLRARTTAAETFAERTR